MKHQNWIPDRHQMVLPSAPVARASFMLLSVFVHLALVGLVVVLGRLPGAHVVREKYETMQTTSGAGRLSLNATSSKTPQARASLSPRHPSPRRTRTAEPQTAANGMSAEALRAQAKQQTAVMMQDIKFRQTYGFYPNGEYQFASRMAGDIPNISAAELPPRFEQFLTVELTIDIDGRVAEARITGGIVDPAIEQKLLSAVREFRYKPAKRDGVPIPIQMDIIIHVPS